MPTAQFTNYQEVIDFIKNLERETVTRYITQKIGNKEHIGLHPDGDIHVDLRLPVDSTELIDMFYSIGDQIHHRMTSSFYASLLEQVGAFEFVKEIESLSTEVLLSRRLLVEVEVKVINGEINVEEKDCMAKALSFQKTNSFMPLIILVTSCGMPIIEAKLAVFRKYQQCELDKIFIHHRYDDNNELSKLIALQKLSSFWLRIARMKLYNKFDDLYKIVFQAIVHILLKENIVKIIAMQMEEKAITTFRYISLGYISQILVDSTIEAVCESLGYEISQNIKRSLKVCTTIPDYVYSKLSMKAVKHHLPDVYDSLAAFLSARPDLFLSRYKLEWRQKIAANVCLLINYKKTEIVDSIVEMCRTFEENINEVCTSLAGFQSQCKPTDLKKLVEEWNMREIFETSDGIERYPAVLTYIVGRKNDKICLKVFMRKTNDNAECFFKEHGRKLACDVHYDFVNIKDKSEEIRKEVREIEALEQKTDKKFMDEKNILKKIVNTEGEKIYAKYSQVIRMGISSVLRRDQQSINKPCIILYCLDKTLIPFGEKKLPDHIKDYPCDIREDIVVFGNCTNCRYVKEGCDIGSIYFAGSAGFLVISPFEGFLTAAHVTVENVGDVYQSISNNFDNTNGHQEKIMHPSSSKNMVGEVEKRICGNFFSYGTDVAIVRMDPLIHRSRLPVQIPGIKVADEKCLRFDGSLKVTKRGRTTNVTTGSLTDGNSSVRIDSKSKPRCYYSFQNCYTISDDPENMPFFEEGDSGSGVFLLDDCNRNMTPLGIAFARGAITNETFVCKIQHIVEKF